MNQIQKTKQIWMDDFETKLKKIAKISYKDLVEDYYTNFDKSYEEEYPEFRDFKKYLTINDIRTAHFVKDKLLKIVEDKKRIDSCLVKLIEKDGFYTCTYLKDGLKRLFEAKNITITAKASLVEKSTFFKAEKTTKGSQKGYFITKQFIFK